MHPLCFPAPSSDIMAELTKLMGQFTTPESLDSGAKIVGFMDRLVQALTADLKTAKQEAVAEISQAAAGPAAQPGGPPQRVQQQGVPAEAIWRPIRRPVVCPVARGSLHVL